MSGEIKLELDRVTVAVVVPSYCLLLATIFIIAVFGVISPVKPVGCVNVQFAEGAVKPDTVIGLAVPLFLLSKLKEGVPAIANPASADTKPTQDAVPFIVAMVVPS